MSGNTKVILGLGLGIVAGSLVGVSGNPTLLHSVDFIAPIGTLWVNAIRMTVLPLVIALLITAVASASDIKALGRIGGQTLLAFVGLLVGTTILALPLAAWVFSLLPAQAAAPLPAGATEAAGQLSAGSAPTFADWLTTLLPTNPFAAMAQGSMVPLILFTILFALAIAQGPPAGRQTLLDFFKSIADAMLVLVRWVIGLAPIGVFALMYALTARTGLGVAGSIGFYIIAYGGMCLLFTLLLYPAVALIARIPIRQFAQAALPVQLIAISSSSSIASLPALIESAERGLVIPERISGFVLPLAVSTFKLAAPVSWSVGALFVARFYHIDLSVGALALIGAAAVFLSFGAPGVPRGAFLMLAPLFLAIGLPVEGIGILIAVDVIPDLASTVLNVTGDLAAVTLVARHRPKSGTP